MNAQRECLNGGQLFKSGLHQIKRILKSLVLLFSFYEDINMTAVQVFWMTYSCRCVAWPLCSASPQVDDVHLLRKAGRSPARTAWQRREALQRGLDRVSNPDGQQLTRAAEQRTCGDRGLAHESDAGEKQQRRHERCDKPHVRWELLLSVCGSQTFPLYQKAESYFSFETGTILVLSWIMIHPDEGEGFSGWNLILYNKVLSVPVMNLFHTASCYKM